MLFTKIFNKKTIIRIFTIFIIGFTSRFAINNYFDINVFKDYTDIISIMYYFFLSSFIVYYDSFAGFFTELLYLVKFYLIELKNKIINYFLPTYYMDDGTHDSSSKSKDKKRGHESSSSNSHSRHNHRLSKRGQHNDLRSKYQDSIKSSDSDEFKFIVDTIKESENTPERKLITPRPLNTKAANYYNSNNWDITYDGHGRYDVVERGVVAESSSNANANTYAVPKAPMMSNLTTPTMSTASPMLPYYDEIPTRAESPKYPGAYTADSNINSSNYEAASELSSKMPSLSLSDNIKYPYVKTDSDSLSKHASQWSKKNDRQSSLYWDYAVDPNNNYRSAGEKMVHHGEEMNWNSSSDQREFDYEYNPSETSFNKSITSWNESEQVLDSKRATINTDSGFNNDLKSKEVLGETDYRTVAFGHRRQEVLFKVQQRLLKQSLESTPEPILQTNEVTIPVKNNKGTFKLGIVWGEDIQKVFVKYKGVAKRHLFWNLWEKNNKNTTYEEFKANFDPNTKIFKTIVKETKSDISREIRSLLDTSNAFANPNRINPSNIRHLGPATSQQDRLNEMAANRHRANREIRRDHHHHHHHKKR